MRLPDPLKKGLILYGDDSHAAAAPQRLIEYGTAYETDSRFGDALEFFWQAGFSEGMERICRRAADEGDFFIYRQAMGYMERPMTAAELSALSRNAEERGKLTFAVAAARQGGDDRRAAALSAKMSKEPDGQDHQP